VFELYFYLPALALGLIVGSFLNVVIHRLPRGRSTVSPTSGCPYCGSAIRAHDNLPLLSYLLLRGRCRRCSAPISWRYPLIEALTAALFVACIARFGPSFEAAAAAIFCALLVALAAIDAEHFLLPDKITLPGIFVGLALQPYLPDATILEAVLGVLIGAGALILLINFWYWLREEEGMGLGDVNMLAMIGAFLGWKGAAVTLAAGALLGAFTGLILMIPGKLEARSRLPFGVFLAVGALLALFFGRHWIEFYSRLL